MPNRIDQSLVDRWNNEFEERTHDFKYCYFDELNERKMYLLLFNYEKNTIELIIIENSDMNGSTEQVNCKKTSLHINIEHLKLNDANILLTHLNKYLIIWLENTIYYVDIDNGQLIDSIQLDDHLEWKLECISKTDDLIFKLKNSLFLLEFEFNKNSNERKINKVAIKECATEGFTFSVENG